MKIRVSLDSPCICRLCWGAGCRACCGRGLVCPACRGKRLLGPKLRPCRGCMEGNQVNPAKELRCIYRHFAKLRERGILANYQIETSKRKGIA